jgi:hypothetical protein
MRLSTVTNGFIARITNEALCMYIHISLTGEHSVAPLPLPWQGKLSFSVFFFSLSHFPRKKNIRVDNKRKEIFSFVCDTHWYQRNSWTLVNASCLRHPTERSPLLSSALLLGCVTVNGRFPLFIPTKSPPKGQPLYANTFFHCKYHNK